MQRNFQGSFIFGEVTSFTGSTSPEQPLLLCKYFDIAVTFWSSYFFRVATFFEQPFFQSSHFFTTVILWELLVFQRKPFTRQLLLENKQFFSAITFMEQLRFCWRNLFRMKTSTKELHCVKNVRTWRFLWIRAVESLYSVRIGRRYRPEKLQIRALFTQC